MSLDTLLATRRHVPAPMPHLGYIAQVPALVLPEDVDPAAFPDTATALSALANRLNWVSPIPHGAGVTTLTPYGLVAPSAWERAYMQWLVAETHISLDPSWDAAPASVAPPSVASVAERIASTSPFSSRHDIPDGVRVRRTASWRGEVRGAIGEIREWLGDHLGTDEAATRCDQVVVLLPADPSRTRLWIDELRKADLPVRATEVQSVAASPFARWVVAVAEVAGWSDGTSRSRSVLRTVFESRFYTEKAAGISRSSLTKLLPGLRRPFVTTEQWLSHTNTSSLTGAAEVGDAVVAIADALHGDRPVHRLRQVLFPARTSDGPALDSHTTTGARAKRVPPGVVESRVRVREALRQLEDVESANGGIHPRMEDGVSLQALVQSAIEGLAFSVSHESENGVRLVHYGQYDGRACDLLMLAGLGEGGFPVAPARPSPNGEKWLKVLGLGDSYEDYALGELERQLALASVAISRTQRLTLSWATQSPDGRQVHPGALLSLLVGGWTGSKDWTPLPGRLELLERGDQVPRSPAEALSWFDAAQFVNHPDLLAALDQAGTGADSLRTAHMNLTPTRVAQGERRPTAPDSPLGVHSGRLPGRPVPKGIYSASALESYGQCGYRYFLGRELSLEDVDDADVEPDPMEAGTALHTAYARASWAAADPINGQLWDLGYPQAAGDHSERVQAAAYEVLSPHVGQVFDEWGSSDESLSAGIAKEYGRRWGQAAQTWVQKRVSAWPDADTSTVDSVPSIEKLVKQVDAMASAETHLDAFEHMVSAGEKVTLAKAGEFTKLAGVAKSWGQTTRREWKAGDITAFDNLKARVLSAREDARAKLDSARQQEIDRRKEARIRRVAHAELAFGYDERRPGDDPSSPLGPFALELPERTVALRGQIDRVDWDPERGVVHVVDYKSGRGDGAHDLAAGALDGSKLQLPLYGLVLGELLGLESLGHLDGTAVRWVGQDKPKSAKEAGFDFDDAPVAVLDDQEVGWDAVTKAWVQHHADGIESGRFDLRPIHCPLTDGKGYCDFSRVCGVSPVHLQNVAHDETAPNLKMLEVEFEPKQTAPKEPENVLAPTRPSTEPDPTERRQVHADASACIADVTQDVAVSAGAGTGKTHNLVRRYLSALCGAGDCLPQHILAVTFTRKAASEMSHRVRNALLANDGGDPQIRQMVEGIRGDADRYRRILLSLSASPISTLDSLALRIVQEASAVDANLLPGGGEPEVVSNDAVSSHVHAVVTERYLDAVDNGDRSMALLLKEITVSRLRGLLTAAVNEPGNALDLDETKVEALWWRLARPSLDLAIERIGALDLDEWETCIQTAEDETAASRTGTDDGRGQHREMLEMARSLVGDSIRDDELLWQELSIFLTVDTTKKRLGADSDLYAWAEAFLKGFKDDIAPANTGARAVLDEMVRHVQDDELHRPASVAHAASKLIRGWAQEIEADFQASGRLRYADVEHLAIKCLQDDAIGPVIASRIGARHVFVDESQDTNGGQVELVRALVKRTRDLGHDVRVLWVGDVKQSIYGFRGAEVDVFEDLIEQAGQQTVELTVNRRSDPPLMRSLNRLFSGLLPARTRDFEHDPGSEMVYSPLTWVPAAEDCEPGPRIELLATPAPNWNLPYEELGAGSSGAEEEQDEEQEQVPPLNPTVDEAAVVERILRLVDGDSSGAIAVLVHAWHRATRYRDLLRSYGVTAVVQGGRGLLSTPEVDHLMLWLEYVLKSSAVSLVGVLRGPGFGVSDAGLYCLRRGWGVAREDGETDRDRFSLKAAVHRDFDGAAAFVAWKTHDADVDPASQAQLLQDQALLRHFRQVQSEFRDHIGFARISDALGFLVETLQLRGWWFTQVDGRQAVANVQSFVDLVDAQQASGSTPDEVLASLIAMRDSEDPAGGGLDASNDAPVVITTYWQAKGLEWPVVVLPDLGKTKDRSGLASLGSKRVIFDGPNGREVVWVPTVALTDPKDPFDARTVPVVGAIANRWAKPSSRAELRRLLYVAMTRAKHQLILAGTFSAPSPKKLRTLPWGISETPLLTLEQCRSWADMLMTALDLRFDEDGQPVLREQDGKAVGLWTREDVSLQLAQPLHDALLERPWAEPQLGPIVLDAATAHRWTPVTAPRRVFKKPSEASQQDVPAPTQVLGSWPTGPADTSLPFRDDADAGTAFHAVMEAWAFASELPDQTVIETVLASMNLLEHPLGRERIQHLLDLVAFTRSSQPELCEQLSTAARNGELFHEVPMRYVSDDGTLYEGIIDLLWRDTKGWHVLDYKAGRKLPTRADNLNEGSFKQYYAQVHCYAEAVRKAVGEAPASYGLWFVRGGLTVQWK